MNDCIEWTGARTGPGYGSRRIGDRTFATHRLAWEEANGPIPDGMCVLHRCDNRPCINPDHLFLGTIADNNRDMAAKGRARSLQGAASPRARLTQVQVDAMRAQHATGGISIAALARQYGISDTHAGRILDGRRWPLTLSN